MGSPELSSGMVFANRFVIETLAGSGGMGSVYRAQDRHSGEWVALKLLHGDQANAEDRERFVREAQLLSELRHPGIVSYVAHGQSLDGRRYLAMEWLEGEDLAQYLRRGPLPIRDCLTVLRQVADALASAHGRGVLHRDLKPSNLYLVGHSVDRVKILDFGIARRLGGTHALTHTGMVVGTPEYMAPEQARGSSHLTAAADMFSIGCVLYECLAGQPPFSAQHIAAVLVRILFEEPTPIGHRRTGVPDSVGQLLERLLRKDVLQRIPDASSLQKELAALANFEEPSLAVTAVGPQLHPAQFADSDRSLFSVVLAVPPKAEFEAEDTVARSPIQLVPANKQSLLETLAALGTSPDYFVNGALVVTVPALASAQDQATMAARAALIIKESWPHAIVSLATAPGAFQDRSAAGAVVDRAAHLLDANHESPDPQGRSGVLLDTLSAKLLAGRFALTPRPHGALLLYEEKEVDASRPLLGKPTPCVGRDMELGILESVLAGCMNESEPRAILATAPAGMGKSRLRHEFLRRVELRSEPVITLLARGDLLQAGSAYRMLARAIRAFCGISGSEPPSEQRQRLQRRIELHLTAEEKLRVVPFLGELCNIPFDADQYPLLKEAQEIPKMLPERLRQACLTWLGAECAAAPVLLVLDDLQWGDALTIALVDEALTELRGKPLVVLALARPEVHTEFPSLWKRHVVQEIVLKGLSKRACERLIQQVLGKDVSASSINWMVEQSAGNALFLEELIRASADDQLQQQPDTVVAMLQARVGHLSAGARRAVLAASVFGQTFWEGGVAAVLGLSQQASEVAGWLDTAISSEMIEAHRTSRFVGQREYGFRHSLVRDAAYGLLTDKDQQLGHQRAGEFIEDHAGSPLPSSILGYHFHRAGIYDKAMSHYLQAGDRAAKLYIYHEALLHYRSAEVALKQISSSTPLQRTEADLIIKQAQCSFLSGSPLIMLDRLLYAQQLLQPTAQLASPDPDDRLQLLRVEYELGRWMLYLDRRSIAISHFDRAIAMAEQDHHQEMLVLSQMTKGLALFLQGRPGLALVELEASAVNLERYLGSSIDALRAYSFLAMVRAQTGHGRAASQLTEQSYRWVAERQGSYYPLLYFHNFCVAQLLSMDYVKAQSFIERCDECAKESSNYALQCTLMDLSAWVHRALGNFDAALQDRSRALELRQRHGVEYWQDVFAACHADTLLQMGNCAAAKDLAERVCTEAQTAGSRWAASWAGRVWGGALAGLGAGAAEVDAQLAESLRVADAEGNQMEAIQTELAWGTVCLNRGDAPGAKRLFHSASSRVTDEMLPCAIERLQKSIDHGLRRAEVIC